MRPRPWRFHIVDFVEKSIDKVKPAIYSTFHRPGIIQLHGVRQTKAVSVMATQLRAASAALRSTLTYQSNRVLASSLVRQASTYTQPSRANGFSFKPRNGEQDARQRVPTARFGMRDPMEGVDGRRERFGSERGFDRSSGRDRTSDGGRRFTVMREEGGNDPFRRRQTVNREERRPHGEGKPYNRTVQPNSYGDRKSFDKPVYEGRRTFERSRPERPYGKRKSEESGEAGTHMPTIFGNVGRSDDPLDHDRHHNLQETNRPRKTPAHSSRNKPVRCLCPPEQLHTESASPETRHQGSYQRGLPANRRGNIEDRAERVGKCCGVECVVGGVCKGTKVSANVQSVQ